MEFGNISIRFWESNWELYGREPEPSAAILDSQFVKTTETPGIRGYGAAKKVKGRKRHILVDTIGLLLMVVVHTADIQEIDLL